jgi:Icc-related predicted phosphoesterase
MASGVRHCLEYDMKILAVADLHYALRQIDWVQDHMDDADILVLGGDLLDIVSTVDLEIQAVVMQKYLERFSAKKPVLASSGNHDVINKTAAGERFALWLKEMSRPNLCADLDTLEEEDLIITVCPWWDGDNFKERTRLLLEQDAAKVTKHWFWVYHNPPDQTPVSWTGKKFAGDSALVEWIGHYQPDLVFSGHIHNAPFVGEGSWRTRMGKTWVFNPGKQIGPEPAHILLDWDKQTAEWHSLEGVERLDLASGELLA